MVFNRYNIISINPQRKLISQNVNSYVVEVLSVSRRKARITAELLILPTSNCQPFAGYRLAIKTKIDSGKIW